MTIRLDTTRGRDALKPRKNAYFMKLRRGLNLGLRKANDKDGAWSARLATSPGNYEYHFIGRLDEFTYERARELAEQWANEIGNGVRVRNDAGKVNTVRTACVEYVDARRLEHAQGAHEADMTFRRRVYGYKNPPNPKRRAPEYESHAIADVDLQKFHEKHLRSWRDDMVKAGMTKSTANRNLTHLKAALNHAVRTRLAGKQLAIEVALVVPFEGAAKRRDIFLDRAQRNELIRAARETVGLGENGALCELIEAAALTGGRPGELVSMVRGAFDNRTASLTLGGKTGRRTVPLSPPAVALFTRLAKSKLPTAPLLTRCDGKPWAHSDWDELIRDAAQLAKLPKGTVLYSLRHSFITEALLGGMATLEVARLVGTSLAMIEKHYGHLVATRARESLAAVKML